MKAPSDRTIHGTTDRFFSISPMQTAKNPFGISKDLEAHHVPWQ